MTELDWFAEDMEPVRFEYKLFYIRMPKPVERKTGDTVTCRLSVDKYGYCELVDWYNFGRRSKGDHGWHMGDPDDVKLYEAQQEVWGWLAEWELVELKPIGPEDSEYFATDKLLNEKHTDLSEGYDG